MGAKLSRRKFLVSTGWIAAGTTVSFVTPGCSILPTLPTTSDDSKNEASSWIQMLDDGRIQFYMGKAEMGQGIMTGLSQIIADEFGIPVSKIKAIIPSSKQIKPIRMTVGSESVETLYAPLKLASIRLKSNVKEIAARKYKLMVSKMEPVPGGFQLKNSSQFYSYQKIMGGDKNTEVKNEPSQKESVKSSRLDLKTKVTGKATYSRDINIDGMLHGKTLYPPVFGATLKQVNDKVVKTLPGIVAIVVNIKENFAGVVAEDEPTAKKAIDLLEASWNMPKIWQQEEIDNLIDPISLKKRGIAPHTVYSSGDWEEGHQLAEKRIQLRSYTPFGTHAPMETWAAVVSVSEEGVKAWIGSQDLFYHQSKLADICGVSKDNVEVYGTYIGGGFGGKVGIVAAFEAARLSMIVKRPVSVRWSREQLFQASYHRSPVKHQIEAGLDKEGNVCFWKHEIGSGPVIFNPQLISRPLQWATSFVSDSGGTRGAIIPYDFKNRELHFWDEKLPVPTGAWRGLGATSNAFATETAVDELARLLGKDTLKFRLENINENNPRYRAVLELAAKKGNWGEKTPPNMGRGIAAVSYKDKTFVAVVAIVSLEEQSVVVNKLICAHDCGLMLNPDIIRSQIEGNLIWGLGMALKENLRVEDGKFNADNFDGYPILRSHEIPEIEIHLIEDKTIAPSGAGEPSIAPTPAAICNAVSSITGRVINTLPIPEQIL